jgi:hypothetical protein
MVRDAHDCQICERHRGEGPLGGELVGRWQGFRGCHSPPAEDDRAPLRYVFIERYIDDL